MKPVTCIPCRKRHLKCDKRLPVCSHCRKARSRLNCEYTNTTFRPSHLSILAEAAENRALETSGAGRAEENDLSSDGVADLVIGPEDLSAREEVVDVATLPYESDLPAGFYESNDTNVAILLSPEISYADISWALQLLPPVDHDTHSVLSPGTIERVDIHEEVKVSHEESSVFEFYLQHAGVWLDIVSADSCFAQAVPRLALKTPVLYRSCLAYSARVMHLWGNGTHTAADHYHNRAIHCLIPLLDSRTPVVSPEILLPTTVLLRMSEQFSEPDEDAQCHMNGAFSLLASSKSKWSPERVDVQGVSFWVLMRQSLRMCFLFEQQCRFDLSIVDDSNMFTAARDDVWTNRITFFLAKVCGVCWGQEVDRLQLGEQLDRVETDVNSWRASIPDSFEPWYNHHSAGEPFPTIRYFSRWHAIGWQQYYTAKTMIAVYRQGLLPLGTYHEVNDYLRTNILVPARMACGVILSGKDIGVGINGGHLAYWCGQFFTGVEEQRIILNWLNDFMEKTKWPNKTTIERLKGLWGRDQRQRRSSSDNPLGE